MTTVALIALAVIAAGPWIAVLVAVLVAVLYRARQRRRLADDRSRLVAARHRQHRYAGRLYALKVAQHLAGRRLADAQAARDRLAAGIARRRGVDA